MRGVVLFFGVGGRARALKKTTNTARRSLLSLKTYMKAPCLFLQREIEKSFLTTTKQRKERDETEGSPRTKNSQGRRSKKAKGLELPLSSKQIKQKEPKTPGRELWQHAKTNGRSRAQPGAAA